MTPIPGNNLSRSFIQSPSYLIKVSLPVISKLLRHKNLQTTERYLQAIAPRFRETMRLLEGNVLSFMAEAEPKSERISAK